MITGHVNTALEATIELTVRGTTVRRKNVKAMVDTGFNGSLTLPPALIAKLGLVWRSYGSATLANGSIDDFDVYTATVIWDGAPRKILVEAANTEPLVGMRLLAGYDLRIQTVAGGSVTIEALQ
jgi:clan AA aspartic protease